MGALLKRTLLPASLIVALLLPFLLESLALPGLRVASYTFSLVLKELLILVLPFIVFSFISASIIRIGSGALPFTLVLVACVFISNLTAISMGYMVGVRAVPMLSLPLGGMHYESHLASALYVSLPTLLTNRQALIMGLVVGLILNVGHHPRLKALLFWMSDLSFFFLKRLFIPILPFFVLGFAFKLHSDGILHSAFQIYGKVLILVIVAQLVWLLVLFFLASAGSVRCCWQYIKNILPAMLTGLGTISSAASMSVLVVCSEKNTDTPVMIRSIIPATINIHTVGSAIGLTILTLATMQTFGLGIPPFTVFMGFAFYYALAKFSVVAVPGGVILIAGPLLQSLLGFSDDMLGLITAVYMIFDPFGTAINVTGNGAFAILLARLCQRWHIIRWKNGDANDNELTQRTRDQ